MITINALAFLLGIELILILAGGVVYLLLRARSAGNLYRTSLKDLESARAAHDAMRKQLTEARAAAPPAPQETPAASRPVMAPEPAADAKDFENCKLELTILKEKLNEKTALLNNLQTKFDDLEKEYLILYRQQQGQ